jgi:hypothetical protein
MRVFRIAAMFSVFFAAAVLSPSEPPDGASAARVVTCSFSNPGYSGFCNQTQNVPEGTSARKACGDILRCLNDARCVGAYCRETTIRAGWQLAAVHRGVWPPPKNGAAGDPPR